MLDPQLKVLADKYSLRLMRDPAFSFRVKTIYRVLLVVANHKEEPGRDLKLTAYLTACVLEESYSRMSGTYEGEHDGR